MWLHSRNEVCCKLSSSHTYHNVHRSLAIAATHLPEDRTRSLVGVMMGPQSNVNRKSLQTQQSISLSTPPPPPHTHQHTLNYRLQSIAYLEKGFDRLSQLSSNWLVPIWVGFIRAGYVHGSVDTFNS